MIALALPGLWRYNVTLSCCLFILIHPFSSNVLLHSKFTLLYKVKGDSYDEKRPFISSENEEK